MAKLIPTNEFSILEQTTFHVKCYRISVKQIFLAIGVYADYVITFFLIVLNALEYNVLVSKHNCRYWVRQHFYWIQETHTQLKKKVNVGFRFLIFWKKSAFYTRTPYSCSGWLVLKITTILIYLAIIFGISKMEYIHI